MFIKDTELEASIKHIANAINYYKRATTIVARFSKNVFNHKLDPEDSKTLDELEKRLDELTHTIKGRHRRI